MKCHYGDSSIKPWASSRPTNQFKARSIAGKMTSMVASSPDHSLWSCAVMIYCSVQSGISSWLVPWLPGANICVGPAGRQAVKALAVGHVTQVLGRQRVNRCAVGSCARQVFYRHVAQPLPLLAAGAVFPGVVRALFQRVRTGAPQPRQRGVVAVESAFFFHRLVPWPARPADAAAGRFQRRAR